MLARGLHLCISYPRQIALSKWWIKRWNANRILWSRNYYIVSWELEGAINIQRCSVENQEGRYCCTMSTAIAPRFYFSMMKHLWIVIVPLWLSTGDILISSIYLALEDYVDCGVQAVWKNIAGNCFETILVLFNFHKILNHGTQECCWKQQFVQMLIRRSRHLCIWFWTGLTHSGLFFLFRRSKKKKKIRKLLFSLLHISSNNATGI